MIAAVDTTAPDRVSGRSGIDHRRRRRARRRRQSKVWLLRLAVVGLPVGSWAVLTTSGAWDERLFASPSLIYGDLYEWLGGYIYPHITQTLYEVFVGFALGAAAGALVGLLLALVDPLYRVVSPLIVIGNGIPRVILAPIFALWLGFGVESKIALVAVMVFFPNFFNVFEGVKSVDKTFVDSGRCLGGSTAQIVRHVYVPSMVIWMLASLRLSIGFAFLAAIVGEYIGSTEGLGFVIAQAQQSGTIDQVFSGILVLMVLVLPIDFVLTRLDRRIERWRS